MTYGQQTMKRINLGQFVLLGLVFAAIFSITPLFAEEAPGEAPAPHRFSMTCKAESVIDLFGDPEKRRTAIDWMKEHGIEKVWIEVFRHGRMADVERLTTVRDEFRAAGFVTAGCITPTTAEFAPLLGCVGHPERYETFAEAARRAAALFDEIILDDFIFTHCDCDACKKGKGEQSWGDFRAESQAELGKRFILEPARSVNPNVKVIIKYPCWYDGYYGAGYDILRETAQYDGVWIGTETREPDSHAAGRRPQTQASWLAGWMNTVAGEKCGGVWFDPIDTRPATYVEQARQSILGGARETLLHCYDYLGTDTPGIALHGTDTQLATGRADAAAFLREKEGLRRLAALVNGRTARGLAVPKKPNADPPYDSEFAGFVALLGLPVIPAATLSDDASGFILSGQAAPFETLSESATRTADFGAPLLLTHALAKNLPKTTRDKLGVTDEKIAEWEARGKVIFCSENVAIFVCGGDAWNLMKLPQDELDRLRQIALAPWNMEFSAPTRVSLHLFGPADSENHVEAHAKADSERIDALALENFNDFAVTVTLQTQSENGAAWQKTLALPDENSADLTVADDGTLHVTLAPRSLIFCETKGGDN